jgi:hypothetical protein
VYPLNASPCILPSVIIVHAQSSLPFPHPVSQSKTTSESFPLPRLMLRIQTADDIHPSLSILVAAFPSYCLSLKLSVCGLNSNSSSKLPLHPKKNRSFTPNPSFQICRSSQCKSQSRASCILELWKRPNVPYNPHISS